MVHLSTSLLEEKLGQVEWYALHTRSRHEKVAEESLHQKGIETFLPLRTYRRRWSDRVKTVEEPLFKGYLFVHTALNQRIEILKTRGIVRFVGTGAIPSSVPERDLGAVRLFMQEEIPVDPFPYLHEGDRVVVKNGPFKGVEGFLVSKNKQHRLVITLDIVGQSASIQIDAACVDPA